MFVTPVGRAGLLFGKLTPYALMAFAELLLILVIMVAIFRVPINGSLVLLLALFFVRGAGMAISLTPTLVASRAAATS